MKREIETKDIPNVTRIKIEYADGTEETVTKGFVAQLIPGEDEEATVTLTGCNISGSELIDTAFIVLAPLARAAAEDDDDTLN